MNVVIRIHERVLANLIRNFFFETKPSLIEDEQIVIKQGKIFFNSNKGVCYVHNMLDKSVNAVIDAPLVKALMAVKTSKQKFRGEHVQIVIMDIESSPKDYREMIINKFINDDYEKLPQEARADGYKLIFK